MPKDGETEHSFFLFIEFAYFSRFSIECDSLPCSVLTLIHGHMLTRQMLTGQMLTR